MNNIDKILSDNYEQLDKLKAELSQIESIKNRIQELKESNEKLPEEFQKKFQLIIEHATEYNKNLGNSVKLFVEGNNEILVKNIKQIEDNTLQLQKSNDGFKNEITRLSKIDLEAHFDKHQSKLSEVFISVNGINSIISTISQNFNNIIKNIGELEQTLVKNQKELIKGFDTVNDNQANFKKELTQNIQTNQKDLHTKLSDSETKINSIISQNELLKKEVDFNKKISFAIILLVLIVIIIKFI